MLDMQGILKDYRPLQIIDVGDVTDTHAEHGEYTPYFNGYNFSWQPDVETRNTPQVYLGEGTMKFKPEYGLDLSQEEVKEKLQGQKLRLPKMSYCWGRDGSVMMADELATKLNFSPILGVVTTPAIITDALGDEHSGYTALSFHKALTYDRIEQRLADVPEEQRLIVMISLKSHTRALFIHKSLLEQWQAAGVDDVVYEFKDKDLQLKKIIKNDMYFGSGGGRDFRSVMDYQLNQNGMVYSGV